MLVLMVIPGIRWRCGAKSFVSSPCNIEEAELRFWLLSGTWRCLVYCGVSLRIFQIALTGRLGMLVA